MRDIILYMSCFDWLMNLAEIVLNLKITFGRMAIFITLILQVNLWAANIFPFSSVFVSLFLMKLGDGEFHI